MSYSTIATMQNDIALDQRITAAAAQEQKTKPYGEWVAEYRWDIVSTPGWAEAWESAVASGVENPGNDPGVITDQMILSAVQPIT